MFFSTRESSSNLYLLSSKCFLNWQVPPTACAQLKPMKTKDKHYTCRCFPVPFLLLKNPWLWDIHTECKSVCQRTPCPILPVREAIWSTLSTAVSSPIFTQPPWLFVQSLFLFNVHTTTIPKAVNPRRTKSYLFTAPSTASILLGM